MTSFFGVAPITVASWMSGAVGLVLLGLLAFALANRILLRMALRNIPRRRAQSVLILFGLMLATLIITASLAVGDTSTYSLQAIQLRQIGGIDEAFTRLPGDQIVQGAGTSSSDFFSGSQAAAVMAAAKSDPNVAATAGAIVAPGSMIDLTTGQTTSQNVAIFGVGSDFSSVWGPVRSRSGGVLEIAGLSASDVYIGNALAGRLGAKAGDELQLYVDGHQTQATVRGVLDTEVNPSIANHGPIVYSVLMPLATMRSNLSRPDGFNLVFVHNHGTGALDDLGPQGTAGDEVTRRMRAAFTDQAAARELKDYLNTPAIKQQIQKIHDEASFLTPDKDFSARLLAELAKPGVTDEFKSLAANRFVDRVMVQAVTQSVTPDAATAAQDAVVQRVGALHVDTPAATDLRSLLDDPRVSIPLQSMAAALPATDPGRKAIADLLAEAQQPAVTPKFKLMVADNSFQEQLGKVIASVAPSASPQYEAIAGRLDLYEFAAYKADAVTFALQGGLVASGALLAVSFFSICVGVLLIFLIFVMLAAERRAEMGMSRAVGLKRRHLTEMFLFEGTAYTLVAGAIGVVLGVLVGLLMTTVLSSIFSGFFPGTTLQYHVEWTSLVIAFCLGILLTFVVVAISAYRVSRLNIVAAIRDLDESESHDVGMRRMFVNVFAAVWLSAKQLFRGHPLVFLSRLVFGTLGALKTFWWALFKRGPMTVLLGAGLILAGIAIQVEIVYSAGVSLVIIGTGLLVRWILSMAKMRYVLASRIGFTAAAVGLLIYWGRPFGRMEKLLRVDGLVQLDKLNGGPEVFALSALMVLLGAIWLVMYNSDLLIRGVMFFTGRLASLAPITRTSMAYPMSTKFRTGMAVAMFGIVTFMIVFMSVFQDVLVQNFAQPDQLAGGWQIVAGTPDNNFNLSQTTSFPTDLAARIASNPSTAADVRGVGWEDNSEGVQLQQVRADGSVAQVPSSRSTDFMGLHAVDDGYLSNTTFAIAPRASGYTSDRAVWDAVRDNVGFAVVDASVLDAQNGGTAILSGVKRTDASFRPFQVRVRGSNQTAGAPAWTVTVIGFMPRAGWNGLYVSTRTAMQSDIFVAQSSTAQAASLGNGRQALRPTGYYFGLAPRVDVNKARLDLGRLLAPEQMEPAIVADQLAQQVGGLLALMKLMTGFLALGLIVGIAGLGVISTRAVVERWQQIGMLRALGYRRSMVQRSFLLESSFIAVIGLVIGALVGVWQSYTFFVTDQTFGAVDFHVPVPEIVLILVGAYLATLLTTFLPARAAAGVPPAEALRYE
jgi:putative ABC transport system permease protein